MLRRKTAILPGVGFLFLLMFSGCEKTGVTFIADPFMLETYGPETVLSEKLSEIADSENVRMTVVPVQGTGTLLEDVRKKLTESRTKVVVLGPIFIDTLQAFLIEFPETVFIIPGTYSSYVPSSQMADDPSRYIIVMFERADVYRRAGWLFAEKIRGTDRSAQSPAQSAAAIFYSGSSSRKHEMEAFVDGFQSSGISSTLNVKEVSSLRRVEELQFAVDQILRETAGAVFFSVGSLNSDAIELLEDESVFIAGERIEGSDIPSSRLLFSIEDDFFSALKKALSALRQGTSGVIKTEPVIIDSGTRAVFSDPKDPAENTVQ